MTAIYLCPTRRHRSLIRPSRDEAVRDDEQHTPVNRLTFILVAFPFVASLSCVPGCTDSSRADPSEASGASGPHDCPTGHISAPDGSCTPTGIQGCADVFIDDDNLCHPSMDNCPDGTIPKFDEGCKPVGIQGCADVFMEDDGLCHPSISKCSPGEIPKFNEGCVPVGISDCWLEFMEEDGLCHPSMDKCLAGTFAVPQEGCVPIDGPDGCGRGTWGHILDAPGTVYVDSTSSSGGDGSKLAPVTTFAEALSLVVEGGRIAVGAGVYDKPLHITKSIEVVGRCPSMVRIQGTTTAHQTPVIVWVDSASGVRIEEIEIGGPGVGLLADEAPDLSVERVHIRSASVIGLWAIGKTTDANVNGSWIEDTQSGANDFLGRGVEASDRATVTISRTAVYSNREFGVFVAGPETEVDLSNSIIEDTLPREVERTLGIGGYASEGGRLAVSDCAISGNRNTGLAGYDAGTEVSATRSLVDRTLPDEDNDTFGDGVDAQDGAHATIIETVVAANYHVGISVAHDGTEAVLTGSLIRGTLPQATDAQFGRGLSVQVGARATLVDCSIHENRELGLFASGTGTQVTVTRSLIGASLPQESDGTLRRGAGVQAGASATFESSAFVDNHEMALYASGDGTAMTVTDCLTADTAPQESDGGRGYGTGVEEGAHATLAGTVLSGNHGAGLLASGRGTEVVLTRSIVERTLPAAGEGSTGRGLAAQSTARVDLVDSVLYANHDVGLFALYAAQVQATGLLVEGTLPLESGEGGFGVGFFNASALTLTASFIYDNRVAALMLASNSGATLRGSRLSLVPFGRFAYHDTQQSFEDVGDGLLVARNSTLDVAQTPVDGCLRAGILFDDSSGTLTSVRSTENRYGLVLQGSSQPDYSGDNIFAGNSVQDVVLGGDLPVPDDPAPLPDSSSR